MHGTCRSSPARHHGEIAAADADAARCSVAARCCLGALVPLPPAWYLPLFTLLAITVRLLLPSPVPRCSVAARCCVGALVPLPRAWCRPPFTLLAIVLCCYRRHQSRAARWRPVFLLGRARADHDVHAACRPRPACRRGKLAATFAGATLLGCGSLLRWRAGTVASCMVPGRPSHCSPSCCAAAGVADAVLPGGARRFCLSALVLIATCMLHAALAPLAITASLLPPWPMPLCSVAARHCAGTPVPIALCVLVPAALPPLAIVASLRSLTLMPCCPVEAGGVLGRAHADHHVHAACPRLSCHHGEIAAAMVGAAMLNGGPLPCGHAHAVRLVQGAGRPSPAWHCGELPAAVAVACCPVAAGGFWACMLPAALAPLAFTGSLLPWPVLCCTLAACCCVGALVPIASCIGPAACELSAAVAGATRHGGGSLLWGRAGTDASCVGPAALHPARHHGDIAGAVADAALLGGGLLLCGCASAYCLVHGAGRPHCAIVLCCCRRCRCRTARLRPAVAWRARADHSVHATCHPHPTCHHG